VAATGLHAARRGSGVAADSASARVAPSFFAIADLGVLALLLAATGLSLWSARRYGLMMLDEGYLLQPVLRMTQGEVLYRDVFAHYGPLRFHLLAEVFALLGPSILVARTVLMGVVLLDVALTFRLARRFAPPVLAALPALLVGLVPGPWTKAFFGCVIALTLLAIARALERPGLGRWAVAGLAAGVALVTRQDVGVVLVGIAFIASAIPALIPARFGGTPRSVMAAARSVATTAAGVALVAGGVAAWYAAHGALGDLVDMTLVRAVTQRSAYGFGLPYLFAAGGLVPEGRLAGTILFAPIAILAVATPAWLLRLRRCGIDARSVLIGALVGIGAVALSNAYYQLYVLRFLQSAVPYYLLATWLVVALAGQLRRRWKGERGRVAQAAVICAGAVAAATLLWAVLAGIDRVHLGAEYTGSVRAREVHTPVEVMGDTLYVDWGKAESIRLLRAFVDGHVARGEPIVVLPFQATYWPLLERPNPLWIVIGDWVPGDFLLTSAEKLDQLERMREAKVRYAFVESEWLFQPAPPDAFRSALLAEFRPVRLCRGMLVLERGSDADAKALLGILARGNSGQSGVADLDAALALAARRPDDPLVQYVAGMLSLAMNRPEQALVALDASYRLDPANPEPLERRAELLLRSGRAADAARDVREAIGVRPSPTTSDLLRRLPPQFRQPVAGG
jgi:hypothetical protein